MKDQYVTGNRSVHSFEEVCITLTGKKAPLVERVSSTMLDCMTQKISTVDFCEKIHPADPYLLRAYIKDGKVHCISSKKSTITISCMEKTCKDESCRKLQSQMAIRLTRIEELKNDGELHCTFLPPKSKFLQKRYQDNKIIKELQNLDLPK